MSKINTLNNIKENDVKKFNLIMKMLEGQKINMGSAPVIDLKNNKIYSQVPLKNGNKIYIVCNSRYEFVNNISYTDLHKIYLGKKVDLYSTVLNKKHENIAIARNKEGVTRAQQAKVAIDALGLTFDVRRDHRDTRYNTAFWMNKTAEEICKELWPNIDKDKRTEKDKHKFQPYAQATVNITKGSEFCLEISPTQTHRARSADMSKYSAESTSIKRSCNKQEMIIAKKNVDGTYPTYHGQVFMWLSTLLATAKGRAIVGQIIDDMHAAGFTNYDDYRVWKYPASIVYYEPPTAKTTVKYAAKATKAKSDKAAFAAFDKMSSASLKEAYRQMGSYLKSKGMI